jgi:hypothetical protein
LIFSFFETVYASWGKYTWIWNGLCEAIVVLREAESFLRGRILHVKKKKHSENVQKFCTSFCLAEKQTDVQELGLQVVLYGSTSPSRMLYWAYIAASGFT